MYAMQLPRPPAQQSASYFTNNNTTVQNQIVVQPQVVVQAESNNRLEKQINWLEGELVHRDSTIGIMVKKIRIKEDEIERLGQELYQSQQQNRNLNEKVKSLCTTVELFRGSNNDEIKRLQNTISRQMAEFQEQKNESEKMAGILRSDFRAIQQSNATEVRNLHNQIGQQWNQIEAEAQIRQRLEEELSQLRERNKLLESENGFLANKLLNVTEEEPSTEKITVGQKRKSDVVEKEKEAEKKSSEKKRKKASSTPKRRRSERKASEQISSTPKRRSERVQNQELQKQQFQEDVKLAEEVLSFLQQEKHQK